MKKYNVILVYSLDNRDILFCLREKEPFKGKYNLVGGKLLLNEDSEVGAYRELEEETGITKEDIELRHLMNFTYIFEDIELQVYVGKLNKEKELVEEINRLYWIDKDTDFFNINTYAGFGNIGHIVAQSDIMYKELNL